MFSNFTDVELHSRTLNAANDEKNASLKLLRHLQETERRRSYVGLGFRTLWNYVQDGLGYSHSQTAQRVASVTAVIVVPEALAAIERKSLSITTAAQIGRAIKYENKTAEEATALFQRCDGKSSREIERILLPEAGTPKPDQVRPVTKTTTAIQMEVDEEFMALSRRAMELTGEFAMKEVIRIALRKLVKAKGVPAGPAPDVAPRASDEPPSEQIAPKGRYIPSESRTAVRKRSDDRCEYISRDTRTRCSARSHLEMHHLNPFALLGSHDPSNLMHVCSAHHRFLEKRHRAAS